MGWSESGSKGMVIISCLVSALLPCGFFYKSIVADGGSVSKKRKYWRR